MQDLDKTLVSAGIEAGGRSTVTAPPAAHARPAADVLAELAVSPEVGLDEDEVRKRQAGFGRNALDLQPPKSAAAILLHQIQSSVVALLAGAAALSSAFGDWREAIAILIVLALNTVIGFVTELKAERSMEALRRIGTHWQRVRRNGRVLMVDSEELVPGDVVLVEAGDVATADARLVWAANLSADESALTGESVPVEKSPAPVAEGAALGDRSSMLHKGTAVTRGSAIAVVTSTGMGTELGQVARLAASAAPQDSPLTRNLDRLSRHLVLVTLVIAVAVALLGIVQGRSPMLMVEAAIALAVAAIPEGLPIVATLVLARGMWRMARKNALIERLSAVETLGATTIILTDKTGTLTENRMTVHRLVTAAGDIVVEDRQGSSVTLPEPALRLVTAAALCNDAVLQPESGDPLEVALLRTAHRAGLDRPQLLRDYPEVAREPFDSDTRMMVTVHRCGEGCLVAVKGAPEAILERATRLAGPEGDLPLDREQRARLMAKVNELGRQGLRVLAFADCTTPGRPAAVPCSGLTLLGFVGLYDPPRRDVEEAIAACQEAGVRVVMVTGDHAVTAASIARSISLGAEPQVIEGHMLANGKRLSAADILHADVLARVSPGQKLDLVAAYQAAGEVVAMTGDGVNDAPALRKADIGVAMGQRGTEVARQAAAMVLRDDSFATIVAAIREGRVIFANIRRFVLYLLACNLSEVMVVSIAVAAGLPLPLLPLQILFLNLVTDVFPAFALAMGEGGADVMRRPPRDPKEAIVTGPQWVLIAAQGFVMTLATLAAMVAAIMLARDGTALDGTTIVTVSFSTLALAQLWHAFNMAEPGQPLLVNDVTSNPYVWGAVLVCLGLIAAACYVPPLADVLHLTAPDARAWAIVLAASLASMVLGKAVMLGLGRLLAPADRGAQTTART
jgi:Ca2+-transporting ATPase